MSAQLGRADRVCRAARGRRARRAPWVGRGEGRVEHARSGDGAGHRGEGAARQRLRGVPGLPRRDDRERRVPEHPRVLPRHVDRRAVLGAQRLQHRLRGVPHRLRPAGRPAGPAPDLRARASWSSRSRPRSAAPPRPSSCWSPPASCRRSAPPCWSRPPWRWSSRPSPRSAGRTRSASGARRPPWRPASARRSAAPWSRPAAGAGRSTSTSPSASRPCWSPAASSSRAAPPADARMPDLVGASLLAAALAALTLGIVKGNDWGWTSSALVGSMIAAVVLGGLFVVSSQRAKSPLLDPTLLRIPSFTVANVATAVAGLGFYAYLLTNILWLQYVWGYSVLRAGLALVPGALVAAVVAAVLGPVAERRGYRLVVVPGALVWAGAYVWYHQRDRRHAGLPRRLAARPGPLRDRRRRHAAGARQRRPGRRPGRPLRDRVRGGVQRTPAGRRPRHRPARRHRRHPVARQRRSAPSRTAGCSRSPPSWPSRSSPCRSAGSATPRRHRPTTSATCPSCTCRPGHRSPGRSPAVSAGVTDVPLFAALAPEARVAARARRHRARGAGAASG